MTPVGVEAPSGAEELRHKESDRIAMMANNLRALGVEVALYRSFVPGKLDYSELLADVDKRGIDVLYTGAYSAESALILRQARDSGMDFQLVSADALHNSDFWLIAGEAGIGARFTFDIDPRTRKDPD